MSARRQFGTLEARTLGERTRKWLKQKIFSILVDFFFVIINEMPKEKKDTHILIELSVQNSVRERSIALTDGLIRITDLMCYFCFI